MFRTGLVVAAAAAIIAGVSPLGAQTLTGGALPAGPTAAAASLSPRLAERPNDAPSVPSSSFALSNGEKLMVLGGAALITGAIISDTPGTIIMIGGGAVLLYGLYLQLGRPHSGTPSEIGYSIRF